MAKTKRSLQGSKVRLLRDITTRGGVTFKAGVVMKVSYVQTGGRGGKLSLRCYKRGWCMSVMGISGDDVQVIEWAREELEKYDFSDSEE